MPAGFFLSRFELNHWVSVYFGEVRRVVKMD